jgi:hypothetical protein
MEISERARREIAAHLTGLARHDGGPLIAYAGLFPFADRTPSVLPAGRGRVGIRTTQTGDTSPTFPIGQAVVDNCE